MLQLGNYWELNLLFWFTGVILLFWAMSVLYTLADNLLRKETLPAAFQQQFIQQQLTDEAQYNNDPEEQRFNTAK